MRIGWRIAVSAGVTAAVFGMAAGIGAVAGFSERDDAFRIDRFRQHVEVAPDGTPRVVELLTVTFTTERRGIFRDLDERAPFPTTGSYGEFWVDQGDVDRPWEWVEERHDHGPRLRIGNAGVWLTPGTYLYRIAYTAPTWTITRRDETDLVEFRMDAPGFDWPTTIGPTTIVVDLPGEVAEAACVEGPRRSTTLCATEPVIDGRRVTFEVGPFADRESATVAALVPAEAFTVPPPTFRPDPLDRSRGFGPWELSRVQAALLLAGILVLALLAWDGLLAWHLYRDRVTDPYLHDRAQPTALPAPPHGFGYAEVAGLLLRVSPQNLLLAAMVDLDQRELLVTELTSTQGTGWRAKPKETLTLHRPPAGTVLPPGDDDLVHTLVPAGGSTVFDGTYDSTVASRVSSTQSHLTGRASGVFVANGFEHDEGGVFGRAWFRALAFPGFVLLAVIASRIITGATPLPGLAALWIAVVVLVGWALAHLPWVHHRKPLNSQGRDAVGQARAFDRFVRTVEGEQLNWAAGQRGIEHRHPALALLPYAIALGHADSWYARFGPVLESLARASSRSGTGSSPTWWATSGTFATVSSTQSATTTAPSSSGGGGGGGSGGGGGGGGSW